MIRCPICNGGLDVAFDAQVLCRHNATYDYCHDCGFLRARNPVWLEESYSSAIASTDTGLVMRNIEVAGKLTQMLLGIFGERGEGHYCDVAGGYGMLTRLMRDNGLDFYWADKYCENFMARGFEYTEDIGPCTAVTAIEIMEHLEDPIEFVSDALKKTNAKAFIFTTELFEGAPPAPTEWWYYSFETGQHIAFFQRRTLEFMAKKLGLYFVSRSGMHIFSKEPVEPWRLKLAFSRFGNIFTRHSRRTLVSKTMPDHLKIGQKLRDPRKP
jgi:hypothetical protein